MQSVEPSGTLDLLEGLHAKLDLHFAELHTARTALGDGVPVFALEHNLSFNELKLLVTTVHSAVAQGFNIRHRRCWLPFVVYATESGYGYSGKEYWQSFSDRTPKWEQFGDRNQIRAFFVKFAKNYGGVVPKGAFAEHFSIIAWPIANAVMPKSLQRDLARLLHEFESGLTSELLSSPEELGRRLAARSGSYTEQFRIFCSNVTLLGSVAAAMLSREGESSPYLISSTLNRIVESLSVEARQWLDSARRAASHVRSRGFVSPSAETQRSGQVRRLPADTDPRVALRRQDGVWRAFTMLPDLSVLGNEDPSIRDELRIRRAQIEGSEREFLPRGWLVSPGLEVRLARWPRAERPFLQLEESRGDVNELLAKRCALSPGPTWLFRVRDTGTAIELKGKVVRPGNTYLLILLSDTTPLSAVWVTEQRAEIADARVFAMSIPAQVNDEDVRILREMGLVLISDVTIKPVGLVASAWDGEGSVEWLVGEPGMLAIGTQLEPEFCVLTLDGQQHRIEWARGQYEQFVVLNDLNVGTHELEVTLLTIGAKPIVEETIHITIRDPQVRPDTASPGEGIRVLASPAWPSLSELMDGRAVLMIDGPSGAKADVAASIRSESGESLKEIHIPVSLPISFEQWPIVATKLRRGFEREYDDAESLRVSVSRSGVGFASLDCDRGFKPLRWRVSSQHDGSYIAYLIDRTDHESTKVELFSVEKPLLPTHHGPGDLIVVPALGGLLQAIAGDAQVATLLPTQPTQVFHSGGLRPDVANHILTPAKLIQISALWEGAELPSDPFARNQRDHVLEAITRQLVSSMAGKIWSNLEQRMDGADSLTDHIDDMRSGIGLDVQQKALAASIESHLLEWSKLGRMLEGFGTVISSTLVRNGLSDRSAAPRFLLLLAGQPWQLAEWDEGEVATMLRCVTTSPVLIRAARFAVLGTRALVEADKAKASS